MSVWVDRRGSDSYTILKIIKIWVPLPRIRMPIPKPPLFPLAPEPVTNYTGSPMPDLLYLVNTTYQVIQAIDSKSGNDCWLCVPLTALSYGVLGITLSGSSHNSTSSLVACFSSTKF